MTSTTRAGALAARVFNVLVLAWVGRSVVQVETQDFPSFCPVSA